MYSTPRQVLFSNTYCYFIPFKYNRTIKIKQHDLRAPCTQASCLEQDIDTDQLNVLHLETCCLILLGFYVIQGQRAALD
jgi:hypothetical protein